ncbi:MAG: DNA cytosine methyltransferase, partial [Pyrinomonadaceae bacterium]
AAIGTALVDIGYRFGAVVMDAAHFLPQSRPRLFIVASNAARSLPIRLTTPQPDPVWHPPNLVDAYRKLSQQSQSAWVWWNLPAPPLRTSTLADLIEEEPQGIAWHTAVETSRLLELMSPINRRKVEQAKHAKRRMVGCIYKRTRQVGHGERAQRAEIRFDDVAGCLRTPAGGSSRQAIMIIDGTKVRSRLLSPREAAHLMGLPENYKLPSNYNEAYHLAGDGVVVPVVRFLSTHLLEQLLLLKEEREMEAA